MPAFFSRHIRRVWSGSSVLRKEAKQPPDSQKTEGLRVREESAMGQKTAWEIDFSRSGPTYGARTIYGHRILVNGIWIFKAVSFPGIFDMVAWPELNHEVKECYKVYTTYHGIDNRPELQFGTLFLKDFDGEEEWWAHFDTELEAIKYVRSLPSHTRSSLKTIYMEEGL
jgi:hypothetical protein